MGLRLEEIWRPSPIDLSMSRLRPGWRGWPDGRPSFWRWNCGASASTASTASTAPGSRQTWGEQRQSQGGPAASLSQAKSGEPVRFCEMLMTLIYVNDGTRKSWPHSWNIRWCYRSCFRQVPVRQHPAGRATLADLTVCQVDRCGSSCSHQVRQRVFEFTVIAPIFQWHRLCEKICSSREDLQKYWRALLGSLGQPHLTLSYGAPVVVWRCTSKEPKQCQTCKADLLAKEFPAKPGKLHLIGRDRKIHL